MSLAGAGLPPGPAAGCCRRPPPGPRRPPRRPARPGSRTPAAGTPARPGPGPAGPARGWRSCRRRPASLPGPARSARSAGAGPRRSAAAAARPRPPAHGRVGRSRRPGPPCARRGGRRPRPGRATGRRPGPLPPPRAAARQSSPSAGRCGPPPHRRPGSGPWPRPPRGRMPGAQRQVEGGQEVRLLEGAVGHGRPDHRGPRQQRQVDVVGPFHAPAVGGVAGPRGEQHPGVGGSGVDVGGQLAPIAGHLVADRVEPACPGREHGDGQEHGRAGGRHHPPGPLPPGAAAEQLGRPQPEEQGIGRARPGPRPCWWSGRRSRPGPARRRPTAAARTATGRPAGTARPSPGRPRPAAARPGRGPGPLASRAQAAARAGSGSWPPAPAGWSGRRPRPAMASRPSCWK